MTVSHDPNEYVAPTVEETVDVSNLPNVDIDELIALIETALDDVETDMAEVEALLDTLNDTLSE